MILGSQSGGHGLQPAGHIASLQDVDWVCAAVGVVFVVALGSCFGLLGACIATIFFSAGFGCAPGVIACCVAFAPASWALFACLNYTPGPHMQHFLMLVAALCTAFI